MTEPSPPAGPEARRKGLVAHAKRVVGAFRRGGYPEDARTRRRVTVGSLAASLLTLVGYSLHDANARTDRALARGDAAIQAMKDNTAATLQLALEVRDAAEAQERLRTDLVSKIPAARVAPVRVYTEPALPARTPRARAVRPTPIPEPSR